MTEERLGFHPASAYNYSGEREPCKEALCVLWDPQSGQENFVLHT
jgi:hypothetical protein